jgi:1,4-alpha-glucan branching enzyme
MATKKNIKATTKPKERKKPDKKVMAKKSTKAGTTVAKGRIAAVTKTATKKEVATPTKAKEDSLSIEFKLKAPHAHAVFIAGDFNGWLVDKDKMNKGKDGIWRKKLSLPHGKHEYQFVVDGSWWTDPENPSRTWNAFGTQNSVKEI